MGNIQHKPELGSADTAAREEAVAHVAPALGDVVCTDERTGRNIIRTSAYDGGKVFSTGFAPEDIASIFPSYDQ